MPSEKNKSYALIFRIPHSALRIRYPRLLPFLACPVALLCWVQHDPFFWDTVQLASKHAHHFYENGLQWTALAPEIDSGHPPVLGFYLAWAWQIFGKTLPVSHWAMLPFLLGITALLYRLGACFGGERWAFWLLPIALLDPVLAGQMTLVSPDVVLAFFFLLAINVIIERKHWLLALAILGLCSISMRGMMTAAALFLFECGVRIIECGVRNAEYGISPPRTKKFRIPHSALRIPYSFLPGFAFAAWFLWWHQQATGWTGYHPGSSWAPAFERAQGGDLCKNVLVLAWRWLDVGRIFEWLIAFCLIRKFWLSKKNHPVTTWTTLDIALPWLFICVLLLLSPSAILYHNLSAHRYFLAGFLTLHLLVFQWIAQSDWSDRIKSSLFSGLIIAMASGNLWVYPRGISMDWDSTLAHQPFHRLRANAVAFLETRKVDFRTVGSAFPNLNTGENLLLNGDRRQFQEIDWQHNTYIFASNIFNDLAETDYERLQRDWNLVYRQSQANVWIEIYQRR